MNQTTPTPPTTGPRRPRWKRSLAAGASVTLIGLAAMATPAGAAPAIAGIDVTPAAAHPGEPITVSVAVSGSPDKVTVEVQMPVGTVSISAPASDPDGDGIYTATVDAPTELGSYSVNVTAQDASGSAAQTDTVDVKATQRLAGMDRVTTAVAVSKDAFADATAPAVVLARADAFPDALAAGALAKRLGGPILLTAGDSLRPEVRAELERVLAANGDVIIVGGPAGISEDVQAEVAATGANVERIAGNDRFETSAAIAERVGTADGSALVTTGLAFPDALAVSGYAATRGIPILLVAPDQVPPAVADVIATLGIDTTIVVGGASAVSDDVMAQLPQPSRISGENRYQTAVAVANDLYAGQVLDDVMIASGANFPDALAGGLLAGLRGAPIILSTPDQLPPVVADFLAPHADDLHYVIVLGGAAAIDTTVLNAVDGMLTPESDYDYDEEDFDYEGGRTGTPDYPTGPDDGFSNPDSWTIPPATEQPDSGSENQPTEPQPTEPRPTDGSSQEPSTTTTTMR